MQRSSSSFSLLFTVLIFVALWVGFAPSQLGGQVSLAVTFGNSMEPMFTQGDLVFIRKTSAVERGDIVMFRSEQTGQDILHRVIGYSGGRYVLQGDNNSWIDPDRPRLEQISGKYWFHISGAGNWLAKGRTPTGMAAMSGVLIGLIAMTLNSGTTGNPGAPGPTGQPGGTPPAFNRRALDRVPSQPAPERTAPPKLREQAARIVESAYADIVMGISAALVIAGVLIAAWSFSQPLTTELISGVPYSHSGNWSYTAPATNVPAIQTSSGGYVVIESNPFLTTATTGQPIFLANSRMLEGEFRYVLTAQQIGDVEGVARMYGIVRDDVTGWSQTFQMVPDTRFSGSEVRLPYGADLWQLNQLFLGLQQSTGVASGVYRILVVGEVDVRGAVEGQSFTDRYTSLLTFRFEAPRMVRVERANAAVDDAALLQGVDPLSDVFQQLSVQSIPVALEGESIVSLSRFQFSMMTVRVVSVVLVVIGTLVVIGMFMLGRWADERTAWQLLQTRYKHELVFAEKPPVDPSGRAPIVVKSFYDLVLLAQTRFQAVTCVGDERRFSCYVSDLPNGIFVYHEGEDRYQ